MDKSDYVKIFAHEKKILNFFNYVIPISIIVLLITTLVTIHDPTITKNIFSLLSISYFFIFLFTYIFKPFGKLGESSGKIFFEKIGYERMAIRYILLRKVYGKYVQFLVYVILFVTFSFYVSSFWQSVAKNDVDNFQGFLFSLAFLASMMVTSLMFFKSYLTKYDDIHLFFSKACFKIAYGLDASEEISKSAWALNGLRAYDRYLRVNLYLNIHNLEGIYLQIISTSQKSMNEYLKTILDKLENSDRLELLRYFTQLQVADNKLSSSLQGWKSRIKDLFPYVLPLMSIIIAIVTLIKK